MRFAIALTAALTLAGPSMAAEGDPAPHRARYDVFDESGARVGATEFSTYGNSCAGFATETVTDLDGGLHDERMTFEPPDGRSLDYSALTGQGGRQLTDVHGTAKRDDDGTVVTVDDSGHGKVSGRIEGEVAFPVEYDRRVMAAALAGTPGLVTAHLLDGRSGTDTRPVTVSTTVAPVPEPDGTPQALKGLRAFRVTSRFFPADPSSSGEAEHVVSEIEYENGVATSIEDRTGGHVVSMQLSSLEMVPQSGCKKPSR